MWPRRSVWWYILSRRGRLYPFQSSDVLLRMTSTPSHPRLLIVAATAAELAPVLEGMGYPASHDLGLPSVRQGACLPLQAGVDVIVTGVGKSNAAMAMGAYFAAQRAMPGLIVNVGIAGTLSPAARIGDIIVGVASVYGDEGVLTPNGFVGMGAAGFALGPFGDGGIACAEPSATRLSLAMAAIIGADRPASVQRGAIATVSICSGTDAHAAMVAGHTGAIAEAMEGAAIAHACLRWGAAFVEVRAISNTTGDRDRQVWDMRVAKAGLRVIGEGLGAVFAGG